MADCSVPKSNWTLAAFDEENRTSLDDLLLDDIPESEFALVDLADAADAASSVYVEEDSSEHSPGPHKKKCSSRKDKTPDTMLAILEKHRHSERLRHHTLNERLKVICKLVPGSADDGRETKVVMMQRVISYIAYLENTIEFLCSRLAVPPSQKWLQLTSNSNNCLAQSYGDWIDEEMVAAVKNLEDSVNQGNYSPAELVPVRRLKVSSPTVDSTTDCVVPDVMANEEEDGGLLSQDSGVPSSSTAGDDDHTLHNWSVGQTICDWTTAGGQAGNSSGDLEAFFSSAVDEGISAVFEIPSSTLESPPRVGVTPVSCDAVYDKRKVAEEGCYGVSIGATADSVLVHSQNLHQSLHPQHKTGSKECSANCKVQLYAHKNKRKQYSPKRSLGADEDWPEDSYIRYQDVAANVECETSTVQMHVTNDMGIQEVVQVLPYNIRCNHRHIPHRRMYFTRSSINDCPLVRVIKPDPRPARISAYCHEDKPPARMDLRKTSWMNGFMMFSRLNRRKYIQAHPGVHTSHISKIMGHAWRNMSPEEQAPYKEKARLCAQELYRTYTSTPDFRSESSSSSTTSTISATTSHTTTSAESLPPATQCPSVSNTVMAF